jgi:hypothetical protein
LEQSVTLGNESISGRGSILIGWADNLNRCHQPMASPVVVNPHSVGFGTRHIDSFWVAPPETYTENYVSWGYNLLCR